jgi:hypothetical protein
MNRDLWRQLVRAVGAADRRVARVGRKPRYSDAQIVKMLLWSVWHDRPLCWACLREHYNRWYRPKQLPSVSQFCRRVKTERVVRMLEQVNVYLVRRGQPSSVLILDGKPLAIRDLTQDRDARRGRGAGRMQTGYKLHALAASDGRIMRFCVHPMNVGEPNTALDLVGSVPEDSWVLADANYDSSRLYQAVSQRKAMLLTPLKGFARSADRLRRMSSARRAAMSLWTDKRAFCEMLYSRRAEIERLFSAMTCFGGGLGPLPSWVRRLDRVRLWVTAKIAVYHARLRCRCAV